MSGLSGQQGLQETSGHFLVTFVDGIHQGDDHSIWREKISEEKKNSLAIILTYGSKKLLAEKHGKKNFIG